MYYETDAGGNLLRALPGYYDGYHADLAGVDNSILSDIQRDYVSIDVNRIVFVDDATHELLAFKTFAIQEVTRRCVEANYTMLPQYKRDNIYSGAPADDGYPTYLKADAGKQSIAKLNKMYRDIANNVQASIDRADSIEDVKLILSSIVLPTESEIILIIMEHKNG
jgi:hypothetical protein